MGIGVFLFVLAVVLLASLQFHADQNRIKNDYEKWKKNQR